MKIDYKTTIGNGSVNATLGELILVALDNAQAGSVEALKQTMAISEKIRNGDTNLTSDEIVIIKNAAVQILRNAAAIAVINAIAPNDLK